jgi:uncharacterized protein (TIGR02271 family)
MTQTIPITDKTGLPGEIEILSPSSAQRVAIRFGDKEIIAPQSMVMVQEDGTYHLPLSFSELEEHLPSSDVTGQDTESNIIPIVQEELVVRKEQVESGKVRLHITTQYQEEAITEPVYQESISIERIPINRVIDTPANIRYEDNKTIVPLMKEVIVVQKQLMLTEEIHISKTRTKSHDTQTVTLRREEVQIEKEQLETNNRQ